MDISPPKKEITIDSPEYQALYDEVSQRAEAIRIRKQQGEQSFRRWLYEEIKKLADILGYYIQNLYEVFADMGDAFSSGFSAGRQRARDNALRRRQ